MGVSMIVVYVAGASAEIERARRVIAMLRELGIEIAHDWPKMIEDHGGRANLGLTYDERENVVGACLGGVRKAELVLFLVPYAPTVGAWVEIGHADALGKRIVQSGLAEDIAAHPWLTLAAETFCEFPDGWPDGRSIDGTVIATAQRRSDDKAIAFLHGWHSRAVAVRGMQTAEQAG
jgi:nucleoside 2-deoxyribosyltransferase